MFFNVLDFKIIFWGVFRSFNPCLLLVGSVLHQFPKYVIHLCICVIACNCTVENNVIALNKILFAILYVFKIMCVNIDSFNKKISS
jgi:hypothetical protein